MRFVHKKPTRCFCLAIHLITLVFTPCSTVLFEKLTGSYFVKKFPAFYRSRRFRPVFIRARHRYLSWASSIQDHAPTSHFLIVHLNIILHSMTGSSKSPLSLRFPHQKPVHAYLLPICSPCTAHLPFLDFITWKILVEEWTSLSSHNFLHSSATSSLLGPNTIQPLTYWILFYWQMSWNFKSK
jgi:hypothetical protein